MRPAVTKVRQTHTYPHRKMDKVMAIGDIANLPKNSQCLMLIDKRTVKNGYKNSHLQVQQVQRLTCPRCPSAAQL